MKRINTVLAAAFVAASLMGSSAFAADETKTDKAKAARINKGDSTQVMPSREDLKPGAAPTIRSLDDNVQRQHDRNRDGGATAAGGAATGVNATARGSTSQTPATKVNPADVRNWGAIDTNKDNLISPEEMETYLTQARPPATAAKAATPATSTTPATSATPATPATKPAS